VSEDWRRYYEAAGDTPRETLLFALARFESEGVGDGRMLFAVDLGCGTGRDTIELLRHGWRVLAVDAEAEAIEQLLARLEGLEGASEHLATLVSTFEQATWPRAELVNASFSLPFTSPEAFPAVWDRIRRSLVSGGRFCGQLFGDRDDWAAGKGTSSHKGEITFQTKNEVEALLEPFTVEKLEEIDEDGKTAVGDPKHWHLFNVVAKKP